jgi:signal peptidase I
MSYEHINGRKFHIEDTPTTNHDYSMNRSIPERGQSIQYPSFAPINYIFIPYDAYNDSSTSQRHRATKRKLNDEEFHSPKGKKMRDHHHINIHQYHHHHHHTTPSSFVQSNSDNTAGGNSITVPSDDIEMSENERSNA